MDKDLCLAAFYRNCGGHLPHTVSKVRKLLMVTAGEVVSPRVQAEDFPEEIVQDIKDNLHNKEKRNILILEALRNCDSN